MKSFLLHFVLFYFAIYTTNGQITFERTYGGSQPDYGYSIKQTLDGGYVLFGQTTEPSGILNKAWLVKTDAYGDTTWTRTFGDSIHYVTGSGVYQLPNGEYLIESEYNQVMGMNIIKLDTSGNVIWSKFHEGSPYFMFGGIDTAIGGGYVFLAQMSYLGSWHGYVLRTDVNGDSIWGKHFDNPITIAYSIKTTANGYFICGGSGTISVDDVLIKLDNSGNQVWRKTFGGAAYDVAYSLESTTDGGFVFAGHTTATFPADWDMALTKTDSQGNFEWTQTYGGSEDDDGVSVKQTPDGGYAVFGIREFGGNPDFFLVKTDSAGNEQWHKTFGNTSESAYSMTLTSDGGYAMLGSTGVPGPAGFNYYFVKTDGNGNVAAVNDYSNKSFQLFPNPTNGNLKISDSGFKINRVEVYNVQGAKMISMAGTLGTNIELDVSRLNSGLYFIRISGDDKILNTKFVKQ